MVQTLVKNWWLLLSAGILYAIMSVTFLLMQHEDGAMSWRFWKGATVLLGGLALAAGACTTAAGLWRSARGKSWLLVLNGFALTALGLIYRYFTGFRISFRIIGLLVFVMAMSSGILELKIARGIRVFGMAGVVSIAFACALFVLEFGLIRLGPGSHADLLLLGSYFGLSAVCMLGLALHLHRPHVPVLNSAFSLSQF